MPATEICPACEGSGWYQEAICTTCNGNGRVPDVVTCETCQGVKYVGSDPCPACFMQGSQPLNDILPEMFKKLYALDDRTKTLMMTYKIFEATLTADYLGLSDSAKDAYQLILSCVFVDWTPGSSVRDKLQSMFSGTDTLTALAALEV